MSVDMPHHDPLVQVRSPICDIAWRRVGGNKEDPGAVGVGPRNSQRNLPKRCIHHSALAISTQSRAVYMRPPAGSAERERVDTCVCDVYPPPSLSLSRVLCECPCKFLQEEIYDEISNQPEMPEAYVPRVYTNSSCSHTPHTQTSSYASVSWFPTPPHGRLRAFALLQHAQTTYATYLEDPTGDTRLRSFLHGQASLSFIEETSLYTETDTEREIERDQ